jgi:hypothetical protein
MRILAEQAWSEQWERPHSGHELWTTGDAARVLRVSREGVRRFVQRQQLACYARLRSGLRLFLPDDVKALAHARIDAALVTVRARRVKRRHDVRQQDIFGVQLRMVKVVSPRRSRVTFVNRKVG